MEEKLITIGNFPSIEPIDLKKIAEKPSPAKYLVRFTAEDIEHANAVKVMRYEIFLKDGRKLTCKRDELTKEEADEIVKWFLK